MIKYSQEKYRGQSLMESIIAVGLVMSVVISSIGISIYTTRLGRGSQNNLVGYNLAREGIEYARNVRDSNWLKRSQGSINLATGSLYEWDDGLDGCLSFWCTLDFDAATNVWVKSALAGGVDINTCASADCELKIDPTYITYNLTTGSLSGFYRVIQIENTASPIKVIVKVRWSENKRPKIITLEEELTNWRYE